MEPLPHTPPGGCSEVKLLSDLLSGCSLTPSPSRKTKVGKLKAKQLQYDTDSTPPPTLMPEWSEQELANLVQFVLLYGEGRTWPAHKNMRFWDAAASFLHVQGKTPHHRSGSACRSKVGSYLSRRFRSPLVAENYFLSLLPEPMDTNSSVQSSESAASPPQNLVALSHMFAKYVQINTDCNIPSDFLLLTVEGMKHLRANGRSNVIYKLAKGLGTMRSDGSDSLFPVKRMPMGLIEYNTTFFTSRTINQVNCPSDYRTWLQSMYILFGTKWAKLFNGPLLSHAPIMQSSQEATDESSNPYHPTKALVNVAAISERTLRRDIASSAITIDASIQTTVLDEAVANSPPGSSWWIKGDACDVVSGLGESVKGVWTGDVDLSDGKLQSLYEKYTGRKNAVKTLGLPNPSDRSSVINDLSQEKKCLEEDLKFITTKLTETNLQYEKKMEEGHRSDKAMFSLAWDLEEQTKTRDECRKYLSEVSSLLLLFADQSIDIVQENLPNKLSLLREALLKTTKALFWYRRTPATHVFVFMIANQLRNVKPYALPVQSIPCAGLSEKEIRRLTNNLIKEMERRGMRITGSVSNGEFNFLRSRGYTRPLSIFAIYSTVKSKYSRMSVKLMTSMLTPKIVYGKLEAEVPNPAVSTSLLTEIWKWMNEGATLTDVVTRLRSRTVPRGYEYHTWKEGETETLAHMMRSILAQMEYSYEICEWDKRGVPFKTHVYVPEINPLTNQPYCEMEDEPHVLKRIAASTRRGGPEKIALERFVEALSDPSSKLTYAALTGERKQSVEDAERLFSSDMVSFMKKKGYTYEEDYIGVICNWRRANDERGLTELQRCRYNHQFLNYILDDLMPWHKTTLDLSQLEVNRSVKNVCGLTRESLIAVTTDIEGREYRRMLQAGSSPPEPPEHPRSGTTDDVECFFSVMRDLIGKNFTVKQVQLGFRKVVLEFCKRLDPDLLYFYHTSSHSRFHEGALPDFNQPTSRGRSQRVPRREQLADLFPGRASLPVRGSLSVRPRFHNLPLELPPPPGAPVHLFEHSYS